MAKKKSNLSWNKQVTITNSVGDMLEIEIFTEGLLIRHTINDSDIENIFELDKSQLDLFVSLITEI